MFFIQGGGLNQLSNANYNGSQIIEAADMQMIVVTHNYRVGTFGFLASDEVQRDGNINAGLLDQRKAMEWVQEHITKVSHSVFLLHKGCSAYNRHSLAAILVVLSSVVIVEERSPSHCT